MSAWDIKGVEPACWIVIGDNHKLYHRSAEPQRIAELLNVLSNIKESHYGEFTELHIYKLADPEPFILK